MHVGIDCSKDCFDFTLLEGEKVLRHGKQENGKKGFRGFLKSLPACQGVVVEATGPYHLPLAMFLHQNNVKVSVVNPLVIKRFSQMKMSRAKTDKKGFLLIAQFGQEQKPAVWKAPTGTIARLAQLDTYLDGLEKRGRMVANQSHAFKASGMIEKSLAKQMEKEIEGYDKRIRETKAKAEALIKKEYKDMLDNLTGIPGIGPKSARLMIVATNGFQDFESYKQVISYLGLASRIFTSGTSVRPKTKICKMGMSKMRSTLYMAANSAIRFNKSCKALYDRLRAKGKSHKQAMIAAVNKLIKQAFAIAKSQVPYDPGFGNPVSKQDIILNT